MPPRKLGQVAATRAALVTALMLAATAAAQEVGARRTGAAVTSPEVATDCRVTFRLLATEAKAVTVSGDFGSDAGMRKGDDGVWSVTVGPLDPEMYVYYFTVDGVRLTDPSNPQVKTGYVTTTTTSLVTVPRNDPAFYDVQDVPHGEIRTLLYKSKSNGVTRELNFYVPPGTDQARDRRYPVRSAVDRVRQGRRGAAGRHDPARGAREGPGIEHTFLVTEGAHHWRVWRRYLRDLAPLLFK